MIANDLRIVGVAAAEGKAFISIPQPILISKQTPTAEEREHLPEPCQEVHYRRFLEAAREAYGRRAGGGLRALGGPFSGLERYSGRLPGAPLFRHRPLQRRLHRGHRRKAGR